MRRLRQRFPDELVVIGVHSGKFPAEKETANIRAAVRRLGIEHPVVNDRDMEIWQAYAIRAWPTVVLIGPTGRIVAGAPGEIDADETAATIEEVIAASEIDRRPLPALEAEPQPEQTFLRFPSKLLVAGDHLFVADSGNHRIVELRLAIDDGTASVVRVIGTGLPGFDNGAAAHASFRNPHGMALQQRTLLIADTGNHAVRAVDLETGFVRTIAGTGEKGEGRIAMGNAREVALRSPWALLYEEDSLLIALAGSHQIGLMVGEEIGPFAGNGREALVDGSRGEASFNQPSDLAFGMDHLFVADSEASAIRAIVMSHEPRVMTMVGQGLFEFGDIDGVGAAARLQHPTGIAYDDGILYIADTYNNKIKRLEVTTGKTESLIGTGRAGWKEGAFDEAELHEPEGVAVHGRHLLIADTNNHEVRIADLDGGEVRTLTIEAEFGERVLSPES